MRSSSEQTTADGEIALLDADNIEDVDVSIEAPGISDDGYGNDFDDHSVASIARSLRSTSKFKNASEDQVTDAAETLYAKCQDTLEAGVPRPQAEKIAKLFGTSYEVLAERFSL